MGRALAKIAGGFALLLGAVLAVFVVGMRRRSPTVINTVRRLGRATKRVPLQSAGHADAYASVVRHVGRTSGRQYETPVRAVATPDGFAIALPYGSASDWVRNLRAAGRAVLVHRGTEYDVGSPAVVPLVEAGDAFSPRDRRAHRLFGVTECLTVRRVTGDDASSPGTSSAER